MTANLNVLLLYRYQSMLTGNVKDHLESFKKYSRHRVVFVDSIAAQKLELNLDIFDAIVIHYSVNITNEQNLDSKLKQKISSYLGPKILCIQDEYRWVDNTTAVAQLLGIGTIFTVVNKEAIRDIYRADWFDTVRFEATLTGFVSEELLDRSVPAYLERNIDVSYRARRLPAWCGALGQEKFTIGKQFLEDAPRYQLKCDISMSERSRIYGEAWIQFLANSKACLGTESGSSFIDYSGKVAPAIDKYTAKNPNTPFEELKDRFLEGRDGRVTISVISPRVFEAAALRTLLILYPGNYSGLLKAGRHYVVLEHDHSNMNEVVGVLRNPERASEIIDNAYHEVAQSPKLLLQAFIEHFDSVASEQFTKTSFCIPSKLSRKITNDEDQYVKLEAQSITTAKRQQQLGFFIARSLSYLVFLTEKIVLFTLPDKIGMRLVRFIDLVEGKCKPLLRRILLGIK